MSDKRGHSGRLFLSLITHHFTVFRRSRVATNAEAMEHGHGHDETHHAALAHHFDNLEQQREAGALAMWVFIAQEVMFFGGLFLAYLIYRMKYPNAFMAASNHLNWRIGALNTTALIRSST